MEEGKKETARLKQQYESDRRRRWRLLEEKGDVEQAVKELYGWDDSAVTMSLSPVAKRRGKHATTPGTSADVGSFLPMPDGADVAAWVARYRKAGALLQTLRERRCVCSCCARG
jgi:hypothetical protein